MRGSSKMNDFNRYVCGDPHVPWWLMPKLMIYRRLDGKTGFELTYRERVVQLKQGDVIYKENEKILWKRMGRDESEGVSETITEIG